MCKYFSHHTTSNFAVEDNVSLPCKSNKVMALLIVLLILPAWLIEALHDGGKIK